MAQNDSELRKQILGVLGVFDEELEEGVSVRFDGDKLSDILEYANRYKDKAVEETTTELLDSLYWMYMQYCHGGHHFMGAGEDASELLEKAGYITVNNVGAIINDNGDSAERERWKGEK